MNSERKWSKLDERPTHPGYYWALSYRKRGYGEEWREVEKFDEEND